MNLPRLATAYQSAASQPRFPNRNGIDAGYRPLAGRHSRRPQRFLFTAYVGSWIDPLFNAFHPLEPSPVHDQIQDEREAAARKVRRKQLGARPCEGPVNASAHYLAHGLVPSGMSLPWSRWGRKTGHYHPRPPILAPRPPSAVLSPAGRAQCLFECCSRTVRGDVAGAARGRRSGGSLSRAGSRLLLASRRNRTRAPPF